MTLKLYATTALAALSLALPGTLAAQEAVSTDTMPADATAGPALWLVEDEDTSIYLFGTVHVLPADIEWMDGRIENAFASADQLVFEIDMDDSAKVQQVVMEKSALTGEQTLRELMNEEDRAQYETALAGFGMPPAAFDRFEPWMAAMTLSVLPLVQAGYSPESGVETVLKARAEGKERAALETVEQQIGLFDTMPMDTQLTYLDETVEIIPETAAMVDEMVGHWLKGDAVSLAHLMNEAMDDPALYKLLLTDRNANWAEWIDQRMEQPGTVFVAVGAGHLAGEDSVQELLEDRQMEVTRIWR